MKYAFVNGYILDGNKGMHPVSDMAVLVDGEKIVGTAATYQSFSGDPEYDWKTTYPYDAVLTDYYGTGTTPNRTSRFNMKTVEQLGATLKESPEDTTVYYVKNHYGDWPSPEIFVINTGTSSS